MIHTGNPTGSRLKGVLIAALVAGHFERASCGTVPLSRSFYCTSSARAGEHS